MISCYRNIVMYGNAVWRTDSLGNSAQQLSLAFLQLGHRVIFLSPHPTATTSLSDYPSQFICLSLKNPHRISAPKRNILDLGVTRIQKIFSKREEVSPANSALDLDPLKKILKKWGARPYDTVFISSFSDVKSGVLLEFFHSRRYRIIYRHVDWFDDAYSRYGYDARVTQRACQVADLITLSHPELVNNLPQSPKRKVMTLTNGVDPIIWRSIGTISSQPQDLTPGEITIGFWGTFWGERIDWPLIRSLAGRNKGWHFNLIGDLQYLDVNPTSLPSNVHLLGKKTKEALPDYLNFFDVCLIPYRQDRKFAKYSNPIKAMESLSAFKPVVCPINPSLKGYPDVYFYGSNEEAEKKIREAAHKVNDRVEIASFLSKNTWQKKAERLMHEIGDPS